MSYQDDSDDTLVARAGKGDRAAATQLILRHSRKIYNVAYRMLGQHDSAEDVVQETFIRMWRSAARWKPGAAKFETWLYRVATNVCLDQLRKRGREVDEEKAPERADNGLQPDQYMFMKERHATIDEALGVLPDRQRLAITLCHYQEMSNIAAAEIMEISVDALESLMARGRRNLRDRLEPMREFLTGADYDRSKDVV